MNGANAVNPRVTGLRPGRAGQISRLAQGSAGPGRAASVHGSAAGPRAAGGPRGPDTERMGRGGEGQATAAGAAADARREGRGRGRGGGGAVP